MKAAYTTKLLLIKAIYTLETIINLTTSNNNSPRRIRKLDPEFVNVNFEFVVAYAIRFRKRRYSSPLSS